MKKSIKQLTTDTLRILSAEMVQKANSGHPGLPLGAAPAAYALFAECLRHNPRNSSWPNRDRFILSAGHGSALLYALLHIFGYKLSMDDLKRFRQGNSLTTGHPEHGHTDGVEISTGPLGQGIASAVGIALAETHLAAKFNKDGLNIVDHFTYVLCGDGCLMEGISSEAGSLAGTLGLGKLIVLYDSNDITIEGSTDIAFRENVLGRYGAYGWHTERVEDGNDVEAIISAIKRAKNVSGKPSLIEIKTVIGFGAPNKQGKPSAHGEPLGTEELRLTKAYYEIANDNEFYVPGEVRGHISALQNGFDYLESEWKKTFAKYAETYPYDYNEYQAWHALKLPDLLNNEDFWNYDDKDTATRISSETILNKLCGIMPNIIGGSADLAPSVKTAMKGMGDYSAEDRSGRNLHFGVREHAMAAIANGIALHGGLRTYISGFFVFSDYMKPALRLSALMGLPVISILSHDSIGVGEDGPTHQPVEHLAMFRSMPNFTVIRPCDSRETAAAWYAALTRQTSPTAIVLSRQDVPQLKGTGKDALMGAYILRDSKKPLPDIILIASGSEVGLICKAHEKLEEMGIDARAVSMPSFELFEEQSAEYKESVLPRAQRKRLAVEAASSFGWERYIGLDGDMISMDTFGASAPGPKLFETYGFTVENVIEKTKWLLGQR